MHKTNHTTNASAATTAQIEFQYFRATLYGMNGSRGREICAVEGCWDSEQEAETQLLLEMSRRREKWCHGMGIDPESDEAGWLSDYQRVETQYTVIPTIGGRLQHEMTQLLNPGEQPEWNTED